MTMNKRRSRKADRLMLKDFVIRIESAAKWEDLALPEQQMRTLRTIAAQVRKGIPVHKQQGFVLKPRRSFGLSVLFVGGGGTGKTLASEVIANELGLDLYRLDLSQCVSKYIGETENNLRRVFDAADYGDSILLIDEADFLFEERSEVKDSHNRYANIDTSYLLQCIEAYEGLAILATNMKLPLDKSFMRRFRYVVNFPDLPVLEKKTKTESLGIKSSR